MKCLLNVYSVPDTVLTMLSQLLILAATLRRNTSNNTIITVDEAQRAYVSCPRTHGQEMVELE